jgi:hypothetical protein
MSFLRVSKYEEGEWAGFRRYCATRAPKINEKIRASRKLIEITPPEATDHGPDQRRVTKKSEMTRGFRSPGENRKLM